MFFTSSLFTLNQPFDANKLRLYCELYVTSNYLKRQRGKPHLSNKRDGLLAHRMCVTNVGLDHLPKGLFAPLQTPQWNHV